MVAGRDSLTTEFYSLAREREGSRSFLFQNLRTFIPQTPEAARSCRPFSPWVPLVTVHCREAYDRSREGRLELRRHLRFDFASPTYLAQINYKLRRLAARGRRATLAVKFEYASRRKREKTSGNGNFKVETAIQRSGFTPA